MKKQNRIREQQILVQKLKEEKGSYRKIAAVSGIALKTIHNWCSVPKLRVHKGTERRKLHQEEFINFLMQDTVTYCHPCKRYAGKRFLMTTWDETYKKYLQQPSFHKHGVMSQTRMKFLKPKYIQLSGSIPLNQCLCDYCENCDLMLKALVAAGVKGLPGNRYSAIDSTLCDLRFGQFGTEFQFCSHTCISRQCDLCGKKKLKITIDNLNQDLLKLNKTISWHKWKSLEGKAPQKMQFKKPLKTAINEFLDIVHNLSEHLFRANWHRNMFQYAKSQLANTGYILQVMDFAMNFRNWYQDEVQSAYWNGTQTTIHGTVNFFKCPREGCNELVTMSLVHITDDVKHDSFLTRAVQNLTFKYLVEIGIPLTFIVQFCDNCSSQYKSQRPFAELSRIALEIIRVYYGEEHGKSYADALFGRLKAWMSYKIKSRHFVVADAHDFFRYCVHYYQTPKLTNCCQHYRVEFQYIRPSDVRRHQDCDLDSHVDKTQSIYSVRNTSQPLHLKVRNVPCLCPPCIRDDGEECYNKDYSDPWRIVNLIPQKGSSLKKYAKRKRPDEGIAAPTPVEESPPCGIDHESDDELPDIVFDSKLDKNRRKRGKAQEKLKRKAKDVTDTVTDASVTENQNPERNCDKSCTWINEFEQLDLENCTSAPNTETNDDCEIVEVCERRSKEFMFSAESQVPTTRNESNVVSQLFDNSIPEVVLWPSILSALENCQQEDELINLCKEIKLRLPPMKPRAIATFSRAEDNIDRVAQKEIPVDGPTMLIAVQTYGDGNCLCRALSRAFFNVDSHHVEIRARLVVEGVLNKDQYVSDNCLE